MLGYVDAFTLFTGSCRQASASRWKNAVACKILYP